MDLVLNEFTEVILGVFTIALLGGATAYLLSFSARRFQSDTDSVVGDINRLLPQTQCAQCGFPGCLPYAEAIVTGEAINLCPPGGQDTVKALANLLGRETLPLENDTQHEAATIARIRESECIGCTLCLPACPVDAIIGAPQRLHSVIEQHCTGCDLCLEPCPVDCIDMIQVTEASAQDIVGTAMLAEESLKQDASTNECIGCDLCELRCPRDLAPQALYWERKSIDRLEAIGLNDCIECQLCDKVCPSQLPLTQIFTDAKALSRQRKTEFAEAERLKRRHQKHQTRELTRTKNLRSRPSKSDRSAILQSLTKQHKDAAEMRSGK